MFPPGPETHTEPAWMRLAPGPARRYLAGRPDLQKSLTNVAWLFSDKILRGALGVAMGVWIARYLGPDGYGGLTFAIALTGLFGAIANLGLDAIVVRDLVRRPEARDTLLGSAFVLRVSGALVAYSAAQVTVCMTRPDDRTVRVLTAIVALSMLFQVFDVIDLHFQSQVRSRVTALARNAAFFLVAAVKTTLILTGASVVQLAWTIPLEFAVAALGLVHAFRRGGSARWYTEARWEATLRLAREAWPLMVSAMAVAFYMRIDQVMLAEMAGMRQVGVYGAAARISEVWYVLPMIIVPSFAPLLTKAHAESPEAFERQMRALYRTLARIAFLIALPMTWAAPVVIRWLYGPAFEAAGPVLSIHIWTALFVFLGVAVATWCVIEGLTRVMLFQTTLGALANVALNLVLIPRLGGAGAAVATLLAQIVSVYLSLAVLPRTRGQFRALTAALTLR